MCCVGCGQTRVFEGHRLEFASCAQHTLGWVDLFLNVGSSPLLASSRRRCDGPVSPHLPLFPLGGTYVLERNSLSLAASLTLLSSRCHHRTSHSSLLHRCHHPTSSSPHLIKFLTPSHHTLSPHPVVVIPPLSSLIQSLLCCPSFFVHCSSPLALANPHPNLPPTRQAASKAAF